MAIFRVVLVVVWAALFSYTAIVIAHHGGGLVPIFFADLGRMAWPGQFNADFMTFLTLSAIWVGWRHQFSVAGLALMPVAFFGGGLFLYAYLLIASVAVKGNVRALLLGPGRV